MHELVERALVLVMEDRIAAAEKASEGENLVEEQKAKIAAILNMTVCDPACGSGHFLLAAARRLGKELARLKTGEDEPRPEDFHLAVREGLCPFSRPATKRTDRVPKVLHAATVAHRDGDN